VPASALLPPITGVAIDGTTLVWNEDPGLAGAQAMVAFVETGAGQWTVLAPADLAGELTLPVLPASLDPGAPSSAVLAFADADFLADWDQVRTEIGPSILETALPPGDAQMRFVLGVTP
jgi:hypothetical protein